MKTWLLHLAQEKDMLWWFKQIGGGKLLGQQKNICCQKTQYCDQDQLRQTLRCMSTCIVIVIFLQATKVPLIGTRSIDKEGSEILQRKKSEKIPKHYPDEVTIHFFPTIYIRKHWLSWSSIWPEYSFSELMYCISINVCFAFIDHRQIRFCPASELIWLPSLLTGLIHKIHQCI